ncbi:MAG TPA: Wzz/FepE/Etk N-terminal domain-containing protein [Polaromonas sp.]|nr:Wzz/FepE/Etk N-terminal domain-containing protein [Polaromonas sp.]
MTHPQDDDAGGFTLIDLFILMAERVKLLVLGPLLAGALVVAGSYLFVKPVYTAKTVILPPQQQQGAAAALMQSLGALASFAGSASGVKNPADQYVSLMLSTTVLNRVGDAFDLQSVYGAPDKETTRDRLLAAIKVDVGKKDSLISLSVDDEDPKRAADMANRFVDELRRLTSELALTEAQQRRVFFEKQLSQTRERLTAAQKSLQGSGVSAGVLRMEPKAAIESYAALKAQVTAAEVRLISMRSYVTENSPEFKVAQSNLAALREQLQKAEAQDVSGEKDNYIERYRDFKYQETLFELFSRQYELAKIDELREGAFIQVVDKALQPENKSNMRKIKLALLTVLGSFVLLTFFVLIQKIISKELESPEMAEKLTQLKAALSARSHV